MTGNANRSRGRVGGPRVILGLCLIVFGVLFTLENFGVGDLLRYWPILLVAVGASKILWPGSRSSRTFGLIIAAVAVLLLLDEDRLGLLRFDLWDLFPAVFVVIGVSVLWRGLVGSRDRELNEQTSALNGVAILGGSSRSTQTASFEGGDMVAFMGGFEADLRAAKIDENPAVIDAFAFWGGVEIKVPADWSVTVKGIPLLGGYVDSTTQPEEPAGHLIVKGFAIMGGVEVKN